MLVERSFAPCFEKILDVEDNVPLKADALCRRLLFAARFTEKQGFRAPFYHCEIRGHLLPFIRAHIVDLDKMANHIKLIQPNQNDLFKCTTMVEVDSERFV